MKKKITFILKAVVDPKKAPEFQSFLQELTEIGEAFKEQVSDEEKETEGIYTLETCLEEEEL